jgi:hypothetical protein
VATQAQTDANRRNSQRSTGPRTAAGKAASSKNAARHGFYAEDIVIGEEDEHEFVALQKDYFQTCDPQGRLETALVLELIRSDWLLRRTTTLETQLWNRAIEGRREWLADDFDESVPLAHGYHQMTTDLVLVQRRLTSLSRTWHRALKDLQNLQSARAKTVTPPPASPEAPPKIGFVPQTPLTEPPPSTVHETSRSLAPGPRPPIGFVPQTPQTEPPPSTVPKQSRPLAPGPRPPIGFVPQTPLTEPPPSTVHEQSRPLAPEPRPQFGFVPQKTAPAANVQPPPGSQLPIPKSHPAPVSRAPSPSPHSVRYNE